MDSTDKTFPQIHVIMKHAVCPWRYSQKQGSMEKEGTYNSRCAENAGQTPLINRIIVSVQESPTSWLGGLTDEARRIISSGDNVG